MTDQEALQGRKLIAEFVGYKNLFPIHIDGCPKYHRDWDALLGACREFKGLTKRDGFEYFNAHALQREKIEEALLTFEIMPVYEALIHAIEWYNSKIKK